MHEMIVLIYRSILLMIYIYGIKQHELVLNSVDNLLIKGD